MGCPNLQKFTSTKQQGLTVPSWTIAWIILSRRPKTLPTALDSQVEVLALTRCARFAAQSLKRWSSKMERSKSWLHGSRFSHPLPLQSNGDTSGIACELRDRQRVVEGKRVAERVDTGGRR